MDTNTSSPIPLWPGKPPGSAAADTFLPWLEYYPAAGAGERGAVLVCPGGGYSGRAPHEAAVVARRFSAAGIHGLVVHYRVAPNRHPAPLLDVSRALRMIRQRAGDWRVKTDKIAVLGFSAGGHLAGSLAVLNDQFPFTTEDDLHAISNRPDAMILCYPVISAGPYAHRGSFDQLLGPGATDPQRQCLSLELQVSATTPPAFLWHTSDDGAVPVENSLLMAMALRRFGVPFELHVYPHGPHGVGLSANDPHLATWFTLAAEWLQGMGWFTP